MESKANSILVEKALLKVGKMDDFRIKCKVSFSVLLSQICSSTEYRHVLVYNLILFWSGAYIRAATYSKFTQLVNNNTSLMRHDPIKTYHVTSSFQSNV